MFEAFEWSCLIKHTKKTNTRIQGAHKHCLGKGEESYENTGKRFN